MPLINNKIIRLLFFFVLLTNAGAISTCQGQVETVKKQKKVDPRYNEYFVKYFVKFKQLVKNNDSLGLAELFANDYPKLLVLLDGTGTTPKEIRIKNKMDFIKYYPKIFDKRMRDLVEKNQLVNLQLMEGGIKLGNGQVWWLYNNNSKVIKLSYIANFNNLF